MVLGYMIGMVLFGLLYAGGTKIMRYLNPEPPQVPDDIETEYSNISSLDALGKSYQCIKTVHIRKTYGYDVDCNLLEYERKNIKFSFDVLFDISYELYVTNKGRLTVYEKGKEPIECYVSNDGKTLISYNPITSKRICEYRKPWKNKALFS